MNAGWNPNNRLYDNGYIDIGGGRTFGCWIWNDSRGKHGWLDLTHALEVSCNYYFADLCAGYDFYNKRNLSIDMDIEKVMDYAKAMGLGRSNRYLSRPSRQWASLRRRRSWLPPNGV